MDRGPDIGAEAIREGGTQYLQKGNSISAYLEFSFSLI